MFTRFAGPVKLVHSWFNFDYHLFDIHFEVAA